MLWPTLALAQTEAPAGVVTTLTGQATVTRASLTQPVPLRFKDSVLLRDTIRTQENSIARVLMGGKALITIRELSALTITEEANRATVDLASGKVALSVARARMRPGESIEIRTPNAVAGVRGTVVIVEVIQASAQAGGPPPAVVTNFHVLSGSINVAPRGPAAAVGVLVGALQSLSVAGNLLGTVRPLTQQDLGQVTQGLQTGPQHGDTPDETKTEVSNAQVSAAVTLLDALLPGGAADTVSLAQAPPDTSAAQPGPETTAPIIPPVSAPPPVTLPPAGPGLLPNSGFETGDLTGWMLTGAGGVIAGLGTIRPPEGEFMAIIHTGSGAVGATTSTLTSSAIGSGEIFLVNVTYNFLSNEFPTELTSFNDTFNIKVVDGEGVTTTLATESRNTSFTSDTVSAETASAGGFTIDAGNGVTGFKTLSKTVVSTGTGLQSILFEIFDVGDTIVDSAALIDAVIVTRDPPLYFLRNGATLLRTTPEPLVSRSGVSETFDSLLVVCCQASASFAGPLLDATNSDLAVPFSLVSVVQDGVLTSSSAAPLVSLSGGTSTLGAAVGVYDIAGARTAPDADTGHTLGIDEPVKHGGVLLESTGASIDTRSVVKIDTALLEATAPLLHLKNGSTLSTSHHAVDLVGRAKVSVPNDAVAMISLDSSALSVRSGTLVNVAGGSVLNVAGSLVSLSNGSTLNILNGLLLNVSGGSVADIGRLVTFSGTGNVLSVTNTLAPTALIGGIPVYGPADSFKITTPIAGLGTAGTITINGVALTPATPLANFNGSLIAIQGDGTVKIGP